jgi:hypothetical protein
VAFGAATAGASAERAGLPDFRRRSGHFGVAGRIGICVSEYLAMFGTKGLL